MSEPSASGRTGRIAARAGLGTLAAIVIAAATVGVIDLAGGGFAGASTAWQHVVALGAVAALGAVLTLGRPAPSHPLAGHPDARPARWRWPAEALAIAAAVATWLLCVGPQPLGSDPQPAEPFAVLLQTDRLADAPADEPAAALSSIVAPPRAICHQRARSSKPARRRPKATSCAVPSASRRTILG